MIRAGIILMLVVGGLVVRYTNFQANGNFPGTDTLVWHAQGSADAYGYITYKCWNATGRFYVKAQLCEDRLGEP